MDQFVKNQARSAIFEIKPYVPGKPIDEVKRELGLDDIIKLASNENPLGPSPLAKKAVASVIDQMHYYPDSNCFYLKQKLSAIYNQPVDRILVGNGSDELLKLLAETFLNPGDEIVLPEPTFSEYEFTAKIMGGVCAAVPLANFTHDLPAMLKAITNRTKIVYICNPNNPTGTIVDKKQIDDFMAKVPAHVLVVFDEAYIEYIESPDYISGLKYLQDGRNVIVFRTFSKIYGLASLRIGYAFTTAEIARAIRRVTEPFNVNALAQAAAVAALDDIDHVRKSQLLNNVGKKYLYEQFELMGLPYVPTEANFIFVDTRRDCRQVFQALLKKGVIVRSGDVFGFPNFIRVTIGTTDENTRFIRSFQEVLEQLN